LDGSFSPIYYNNDAIQILSYPGSQPELKPLERFLGAKVRSLLVNSRSPDQPSFIPGFVSGRRRYVCRMFSLDSSSFASTPGTAVAVLLERGQQKPFDSSRFAAQFHLSQREREAVELLIFGLTSKEIANRMQISPSTVKVFLRMAMVKVGVSTRSGLVGRMLDPRLCAGAEGRLLASGHWTSPSGG
jgi:DNA-binding CsgD family transcriptional regulator